MAGQTYFHPKFPLALAIISLCASISGCGLFSQKTEVEIGPAPSQARRVVQTAAAQMGKKYRLGGSSPQKGFDCSGLVWWAYSQNGLKVPRITSEQARTGRAIPKKQARAGDIMVFRVSQSPRGLHTGLYAGGGAFIHSPSRGKRVCLEKLAPWWHKRLVAVRRVVRK